MKKGDLVWIPSDARLVQFGPEKPTPTLWCTVKEPTYGVILEEVDDAYIDVIYHGERWPACKSDVYETSEEGQVVG